MEKNIKHKVLVVDDEQDIVELLTYNLNKEGYQVQTAGNGKEAIKVTKTFFPDLILLDIMMPKLDGVETARILREMPEAKNAFIVFLTARVEEYSEIAAFDVGADDYITKPIKPRALLVRIKALFRRQGKLPVNGETKISIKDLIIDRTSYTVQKGTETLSLPKKEFELLYFLAQNPNKVFSRDELLQNIWGSEVYVLARTIDVHIRKIREKIGDNYIKTVKGVGYKMPLDK